jgi:hypothetical protein
MNPVTNPYTRENLGAPRSRMGAMGTYLSYRGLRSSAYIPNRFDRDKIKNWSLYFCTLPAVFPGVFTIAPNDTLEFESILPPQFALESLMISSNQPESVRLTLYDMNRNQAIINPGGPELMIPNLGGTGKFRLFLKSLYFFEPSTTLLASIANLSANQQSGQIILVGYTPGSPGMVE